MEYEQASQAERARDGNALNAVRINEMERKVSNSFLNGLKHHVLKYVSERPNGLSEAVSVALEAESVSSIRYKNRKLEEANKPKNDSNSQNF